mgnify:CR=1 FL=1
MVRIFYMIRDVDDENVEYSITAEGHANSDDEGNHISDGDDVCIAVSALIETLARRLNDSDQDAVEGKVTAGDCRISTVTSATDAWTDTVFGTIMCGLNALEDRYPEFVSIE